MERVLGRMEQMGLSQLIVSDPLSIFYLTGVMIHPGERLLALLLRQDGGNRLFVNRLFPEPDTDLPVVWFTDTDDTAALMASFLDKDKPLGVDKNWPARFLIGLMEVGAASAYVNGSMAMDYVRAVKDEEEQEKMRISSQINDACMEEFARTLRYGMTEVEMESLCRSIYEKHGCECVSFDPIVGFGANGADPHHGNDDTVLRPGMTVLLDVGGKKDGYCSDMTRTFFTAEPSEEERTVYELVRQANEKAESIIRPGVRLCDIDAAARDLITEAGYGVQFNHRLGHFIGLDEHEYGDVSSGFDWPVEAGMIFSIEPGIYLPGKFGVRIEDLVLVTENGCQVLNSYPKGLTVLNLEEKA
jgi:Xaa-Pro dipeptidase